MKPNFRFFPIALIVVGTLLLLAKQDVITLPSLHGWWPLVLVVLGVKWLVWPSTSRRCRQAD